MVIYLYRRKVLLNKIFTILIVLTTILGSGYFISYFKYNDYDLIELESLKEQNKLLEDKLSAFNELYNDNYIIGKVIIRNIHDFYNEIVINLGTDNLVQEGDAVLNNEGLIGVVYKVDKNKSFVKLLSGDYNVSVKVKDTYGNLNKGKISLLDKYSNLNIGDKVYTSGYSEMPEGIYIGEIEKIDSDNEELGQIAKIKLLDNKNLNYIAVFTRSK